MLGLDQTMTVYGEGASTFDQVLVSDLPCRLAHVNAGGSSSASQRAELLAMRRLLWGPEYVMPENVQIEVAGIRWAAKAGTFGALRGPTGAVMYRAADVVRQVV
jgi:hypothetical protein